MCSAQQWNLNKHNSLASKPHLLHQLLTLIWSQGTGGRNSYKRTHIFYQLNQIRLWSVNPKFIRLGDKQAEPNAFFFFVYLIVYEAGQT